MDDDDEDENEFTKKIQFEKINPDIPEAYEKYTFNLKKSEAEGSYKAKLRLIAVIIWPGWSDGRFIHEQRIHNGILDIANDTDGNHVG